MAIDAYDIFVVVCVLDDEIVCWGYKSEFDDSDNLEVEEFKIPVVLLLAVVVAVAVFVEVEDVWLP